MDLIKKGAHGLAVQDLQRKLVAAGEKLDIDGWYGDATEQAVASYQRRAGLVVDGVAGPKTLETLGGKTGPTRLGEAELIAAAEQLGVPLACVKAVNAVESRGSGFLEDGRAVILFERHVFHKRLPAELASELAAKYPALCNPKRGGYAGGAAEWQRVLNAASVSGRQGIAYESASWGLFQVMGYHWQALGYANVGEFVAKMGESEGNQLEAFVRFIAADPALHKALKAKKWAEFARLYNGLDYEENLYDVKLARACAAAERLAA